MIKLSTGSGTSQDHEHSADLARLQLVESMLDPKTIRLLRMIDVAPGWSCLDVGPGTGTVLRWLADRVGSTGQIAVTDANARSLDHLDLGKISPVPCHRVAIDNVGANRYDLIHYRSFLAWFDDPIEMLRKMVRALRPGGWLLLEQPGGNPARMDASTPEGVEFNRVSRLIHAACASHGVDFSVGLRLPWLLADLGLTEIAGEATERLVRGGPLPSLSSWLTQRWNNGLLASGLLTQGDLDAHVAAFRDPGLLIMDDAFVSVLGCKPR